MPFWITKARWKRRTLSALGLFVPYHLICCYNLSEMAYNPLLFRMLQNIETSRFVMGFILSKNRSFHTNRTRLLITETRVSVFGVHGAHYPCLRGPNHGGVWGVSFVTSAN